MKTVIKIPQHLTPLVIKDLFRPTLLAALVASLAACASYRDVAPNAPLSEATRIMGQPNHSCDRPDGSKQLVWSSQPMGQYIYGAQVDANNNLVGSVYSVMTGQNFRKLDSGVWSDQDVLCEFGTPAEIETLGLGEKREQVWSYRYKESNVWNKLLHIYMGKDGQQVTRWHTGPDPLFERDCWFMGC